MKIYFCDGCNESIPLEDLKNGQASTIKGKLFCRACNPLNTLPDVKQPTGAGLAVTIGLFFVAMLAAGGAAAYSYYLSTQDSLDDEVASLTAAFDARAAELQGRLKEMRDSQTTISADLAKLREELAVSRQSGADSTHRLERSEKKIQEMFTLMEALRADRESYQRLEMAQGALDESIAQLRENMASLEGKVSAFSAFSELEPRSAEPLVGIEPEVKFSPETNRLIKDLDNRDASVRWSAVDRLAGQRDAALTPYLVPLLEDPDAFVQFRVISALRELNARLAVGKLIELLRDGDAIVREEALEALVALTGNPARFDVTNASPAEREKGVRIWEDWYKANRDRFEAEG